MEVHTMAVTPTDRLSHASRSITLDEEERVRVPRAAAYSAALLRISLGLVYLWAFVSQAFGISYTNTGPAVPGQKTNYGWHFSSNPDNGWISSGFSHSPTAGYVDKTHGPLAFIPQDVSTGLDDLFWMVAIGGLGIALTLGI